ncbi:helix-turn-helix domain-containing protein [Brevibacillus thermoruber]|uniref:helix-turn-helix domain-containing protein n=1 Tax=Brevibacillus thermoruber TaxID=33942 RepID=UPI00041F7D31|nr:helix-turn-helix domain-containing protein [Brevibacillus thermoruber]
MREKTHEELLEEELIWERQEDEIDLFTWWQKGIELYRKLSRLDRDNKRFKIQLANLLLKAGGDLKMRQHNFNQALGLFRELIWMEPEHAIAHYRLGFLYYYKQDWRKSIHHFERALRARPAERSHQIHREQEMKALCYLAKAYQKLSLSIFEKANEMFEAESDPAVADAVDPFIEETRRDLYSYGESKPYVMVTQDQTLFLHEDEVLRYQSEELAANEVRLDFLGEEIYLIFPSHVRIKLSEQLGKLLRFLMENKRPVSAQTIRENIFPDSRSESIVRRTIQRLRDALDHPRLPVDLILTTISGYQWNWPGEFTIFYRKDDIFLKDIIHF